MGDPLSKISGCPFAACGLAYEASGGDIAGELPWCPVAIGGCLQEENGGGWFYCVPNNDAGCMEICKRQSPPCISEYDAKRPECEPCFTCQGKESYKEKTGEE